MSYNFPDAPTLGQAFQGWSWDGEKWVSTLNPQASGAVRYDLPQGLTANQMAQARSNIDVTKKNYIINGAMQVSQENGQTSGTANAYYPVDQFAMLYSNAGTQTAQQVSSFTPGGSTARLRVTATTADASVAAGDFLQLNTRLEGFRVADLKIGSVAGAKTATLQFGVKAPAGTYCIAFMNQGSTRTYVAEYTIAAGEANQDVTKSITLNMDTGGPWDYSTLIGLDIRFTLMTGTTYQATPNTWIAGGPFLGSSNQFNFMSTTAPNNVFELFDVSLTEGSVAPPFQVPDYASELALCTRYYRRGYIQMDATAGGAGVIAAASMPHVPPMRGIPTVSFSAVYAGNNNSAVTGDNTIYGTTAQVSSTAAGRVYWLGNIYCNARL